MASFVKCPECGFCIGEITQFFLRAKEAYVMDHIGKKKLKYDIEKMTLCDSIMPELKPLLDALGATNACCRTHLLSMAQFDKTYK